MSEQELKVGQKWAHRYNQKIVEVIAVCNGHPTILGSSTLIPNHKVAGNVDKVRFRELFELSDQSVSELETLQAARDEIIPGFALPEGRHERGDALDENQRVVAAELQAARNHPDAGALAIDMLTDLGYTFDDQSWIAGEINIAGSQRYGAALNTLRNLGFTYHGGELWAPPIGKKPAFTAPDLLASAEGHLRDRAATYDKPGGERSMGATVEAFNAQTGRDLTEAEGWLLMVNLKIVRDNQREKPHRDSCEDMVAYGALYAEARLGSVGPAEC